LFQGLFPKAGKKVYSLLDLKKNCMQMPLIQHVVSFLLYANGTNREVRINEIFFVLLLINFLGIHIPAAIYGLHGTINNQ